MIALFTDYGFSGPYVGQLKAAISTCSPGVEVIDLQHDAPVQNPRAAAYLLAALCPRLPEGAAVLAVVDPGVGTDRRGAIVEIDGRWLVGPDNGLFNVLAMHGRSVKWWDIDWQPEQLSDTFHGRDLFAPVAACLARGDAPPGVPIPAASRIIPGWPEDLPEIVYIDHFGNAMTGLRAGSLQHGETVLGYQGENFHKARTFADVDEGTAFWYANSIGLVEIAANRRRAADLFNLSVGDRVVLQKTGD